MSMLNDAIAQIATLISDDVSDLGGRVYPFRADRETEDVLPACSVDIESIAIDQTSQRNIESGLLNNKYYIAHRYGDYQANIVVSVVTQKLAQAVEISDAVLRALLFQMTIESEYGFGRLTSIQEPTTGMPLQIRSDPGQWSIEYEAMAADRVLARISGRVTIPFVTLVERPEMDVSGVIDVQQGG